MGILTLLTDFGTRDYYVAAVKGVILAAAPGATLVDISHEVAPGNLAETSFLLQAAAPCFPTGTLHLAIVDPGVGSTRRLLVVEAAGCRFLAPDNGLLTPWLDRGRSWAIDRPDLYRESPGATFHGRDRFAPVAATILNGQPLDSLGSPVTDALRLPANRPRQDRSSTTGSVVHIDRFGNLVTDIPWTWLGRTGAVAIQVKAEWSGARQVTHYAELEEGEVGILCGSLGTVELSLRGRSLAAFWGVEAGVAVRLGPKSEDSVACSS
jgi:S-adenosyl-L-methionine hydrolase (adenosine-forming)